VAHSYGELVLVGGGVLAEQSQDSRVSTGDRLGGKKGGGGELGVTGEGGGGPLRGGRRQDEGGGGLGAYSRYAVMGKARRNRGKSSTRE